MFCYWINKSFQLKLGAWYMHNFAWYTNIIEKMAAPMSCWETLHYAKNIFLYVSLIHLDGGSCRLMGKKTIKSLRIAKVISWGSVSFNIGFVSAPSMRHQSTVECFVNDWHALLVSIQMFEYMTLEFPFLPNTSLVILRVRYSQNKIGFDIPVSENRMGFLNPKMK